jgi:hypothetical protein
VEAITKAGETDQSVTEDVNLSVENLNSIFDLSAPLSKKVETGNLRK